MIAAVIRQRSGSWFVCQISNCSLHTFIVVTAECVMRVFVQTDNAFDMYTKKETLLVKQRYFYDLPMLLQQIWAGMWGYERLSQDVFLLHESYFDCVQFRIEITARTPFSILDLKEIIREKVTYMKHVHRLSSLYCKHRISNISINTIPSDYLLWKTGDLSFCVQFFLLKVDAITAFKLRLPDTALIHRCALYPKQLFLLERMHTHLHTHDVPLLYISERVCQLFRIREGRYHAFDEIAMGEALLKSCYEEHNVIAYFHYARETVEQNALLKKLIKEALWFYTHQLCQRIHQFLLPWQQVIVAGGVLANPLFFDAFQQEFRSRSSGFAIPLPSLIWCTRIEGYHASDISAAAYFASACTTRTL